MWASWRRDFIQRFSCTPRKTSPTTLNIFQDRPNCWNDKRVVAKLFSKNWNRCGGVMRFIPMQLPTNVPRDLSNETAMWARARDLLNGRNWKRGFIYEKIEFNGTSGHLQWILIVCWWEMLLCSPAQHLSQRAISVCPVRLQVLHLYSLSLPGCWLSNAFFFHKSLMSKLQFI